MDGWFFNLFGALAEFERHLIRKRTQAGLSAVRVGGRQGGRKKRLDLTSLCRCFYGFITKEIIRVEEICRMMGADVPRYTTSDGKRKRDVLQSPCKEIPADSLLQLQQRLDRLPRKSAERTSRLHQWLSCMGYHRTTVYPPPALSKPWAATSSRSRPTPPAAKTGTGTLSELVAALKTAYHETTADICPRKGALS